jgi:dihydroflavonol-4-reductase
MSTAKSDTTVLVTGGTGFVGVHCILQLLSQGYKVKTTLRSPGRKNEVIEMLKYGGATSVENVSFVEADLAKDANWDAAVSGCEFVLHVASPIGLNVPKDENEMIVPAVEGTLRILRAAKQAGVKRVVLTSSFAAVGYSHKDPKAEITEESWTNPKDRGLSAYLKSKTLAEMAAWEYIKKEGGALELAVVNPVAIFGPTLGPDMSSAFEMLKQVFDGKLKALPQISFGIVDVRDVADLHLRAMTNPAANGQRFLAIAGVPMSFYDIATLLKNKMGDTAKNVTTKLLPNWQVRVAALFSPAAKNIAPQIGKIKAASNAKAKKLLGWMPRSNEEAILASAQSMVKFGLIKQQN